MQGMIEAEPLTETAEVAERKALPDIEDLGLRWMPPQVPGGGGSSEPARSGGQGHQGPSICSASGGCASIYAPWEIRTLHLELSTNCNALCPQCSRTQAGACVNRRLRICDLSLEDVQLIIPMDFAQQLRKVFLCGNYGDPGMAPQCLEVVRYLLACNPKLKVGVHTNGGMRTSGWWRDLGEVLRAPSYCRFAIDGLEDTNHLYRQRVSWRKLMRNVAAFVGAGGNAEWDFLVFRHNEHQVEAARQLSVSLGFSRFQVKSTARFLHRERAELLEGFDVLMPDGGVSHVLRPPEDPQYRNVALEEDAKRLLGRYGSMEAYFDSAAVTTTSCKSAADKDIYVSAERLVFPCCWLAGHIYNTMADSRRQVLDVLSDRGLSIEDIRVTEERSVTGIASGPFFDGVAESWGRGSVAAGKVRTCAMMCGQDLQPFAKQFLAAQQQPGGAGRGNDKAAGAASARNES